MFGAILRSVQPRGGVFAARLRPPALHACRTVSTAAASTASAAVQQRPAAQEAFRIQTDPAQQSAAAPADASPATQPDEAALPVEPRPQTRAADPRVANGTFIRDLRIRDFALVEDQVVRLAPGLNVITGESGAGKSVLVEAFASILGSPAPEDCVRPPAEAAVVEGTVQLSPSALVR